MVQSMPEASPSKWHQAHTTWFFETFILRDRLPGYRPFDPRYRFLFNSYYKQVESFVSAPHPFRAIRGTFSRPELGTIRAFRRYVDEQMISLLLGAAGTGDPELTSLVELGIHHEQQHQELILTDIKHALWMNPLRPAYLCKPEALTTGEAYEDEISPASRGPEAHWHDFAGGLLEIGHAGPQFAFDNELPRHRVYLEPFGLASRLVTNREYLDFMDDGGYQRPELWLSDGWDTVLAHGWEAPLYWERQDGEWLTFTLSGTRPVNADEPVCHVSYYEADAYARWRGERLPTEAEWETAAAIPSIAGNLLETERFHPAAAGAGLAQMFGDAWEWTSSQYVAYPGYAPATGALGEYNGKFMCNQFVLRGGSCATPRSHLRPTYRNFFPPQARWQFSGIRLAHGCS